MPRRARLIVPEAPHHIIQRGHNKARVFYGREDYELYLGLLQEHAPESGCDLHAYVLMTNHVHLLLTPRARESFSRLMATVNQRYVQSVNRRKGRCGSSWQGRFRSCLVDTESYFLTCQRYIELNPVRAGMVRRPADYAWSSYSANALGLPCPMLTPHPCFLSLGELDEARRRRYRALFEAPITQDELDRIRLAAAGNRPLGDDAFLDRMEARFGIRVRRATRGPPQRRPSAGEPRAANPL